MTWAQRMYRQHIRIPRARLILGAKLHAESIFLISLSRFVSIAHLLQADDLMMICDVVITAFKAHHQASLVIRTTALTTMTL